MASGRNHFNILIVEDDPIDASFLREAFDRYGDLVRIEHIDRGEEAMARLRGLLDNRGDRPHLIVIDVNLPDIDGSKIYALCSFSSGSQGIPLVIFTGGGHDGLKTCSETDPRMIYLLKPDSRDGYDKAADTMLRHAATYMEKNAGVRLAS
ncbi:MAG: response regulator [Rhodobiaceae bacterium]|nr:response regulator [Rhodobiaceae bacterium]